VRSSLCLPSSQPSRKLTSFAFWIVSSIQTRLVPSLQPPPSLSLDSSRPRPNRDALDPPSPKDPSPPAQILLRITIPSPNSSSSCQSIEMVQTPPPTPLEILASPAAASAVSRTWVHPHPSLSKHRSIRCMRCDGLLTTLQDKGYGSCRPCRLALGKPIISRQIEKKQPKPKATRE